jgi:hypothetical protein
MLFRVNNNDFTPKNHIFPNCGGRREHFWGISCEKSRFYAKKKSYFFPILDTKICPTIYILRVQSTTIPGNTQNKQLAEANIPLT